MNKNFNIKFCKFYRNEPTKKYLAWLNDKKTIKYTSIKNKQNFKRVKKYVILNKLDKNVNFLKICIKKKKNYIHIGNIRIVYDNNEATIALIIGDSRYKNIGIGNYCLIKTIKLLKKKKLKLLKAFINKKNAPSIKIFKKNGFTNINNEIWALKT